MTDDYAQYIFSVNSGSNTISMFAISSQYPTQPQLIDTVSTGGYFPMSVAYSEYLQKGRHTTTITIKVKARANI